VGHADNDQSQASSECWAIDPEPHSKLSPSDCSSGTLQFNQPLSSQNSRLELKVEIANMSSKYAFTKAIKEVRFLFCQTGEASAATRCVAIRSVHGKPRSCMRKRDDVEGWDGLQDMGNTELTGGTQGIRDESVPDDEEEQPQHPHHDPRSIRYPA
jgi:hypothetical protein